MSGAVTPAHSCGLGHFCLEAHTLDVVRDHLQLGIAAAAKYQDMTRFCVPLSVVTMEKMDPHLPICTKRHSWIGCISQICVARPAWQKELHQQLKEMLAQATLDAPFLSPDIRQSPDAQAIQHLLVALDNLNNPEIDEKKKKEDSSLLVQYLTACRLARCCETKAEFDACMRAFHSLWDNQTIGLKSGRKLSIRLDLLIAYHEREFGTSVMIDSAILLQLVRRWLAGHKDNHAKTSPLLAAIERSLASRINQSQDNAALLEKEGELKPKLETKERHDDSCGGFTWDIMQMKALLQPLIARITGLILSVLICNADGKEHLNTSLGLRLVHLAWQVGFAHHIPRNSPLLPQLPQQFSETPVVITKFLQSLSTKWHLVLAGHLIGSGDEAQFLCGKFKMLLSGETTARKNALPRLWSPFLMALEQICGRYSCSKFLPLVIAVSKCKSQIRFETGMILSATECKQRSRLWNFDLVYAILLHSRNIALSRGK